MNPTEKCACCGANRDGSFELTLMIAGACDCADRAPTVPDFREPGTHLPDCRLRRMGRDMALRMAFNLGMHVEISPLRGEST